MSNRFEQNRRNPFLGFIFYLPIMAFIGIFLLFWKGIDSVSATTLEKQRESLETAISRSVSQCYVVEGTYPPSLEYLKEHYGLLYNENLFFVDYQSIGSNILPDITILYKSNNK